MWIQFADKEAFLKEEAKLYELLKDSEGKDGVVIFLAKEKATKRLPANRNIHVDSGLLVQLNNYFGESRVKVVEKAIEKM